MIITQIIPIYSKYIAKDDKATRTIFGDGAAATLIQADEKGEGCLNGFVFGSNRCCRYQKRKSEKYYRALSGNQLACEHFEEK